MPWFSDSPGMIVDKKTGIKPLTRDKKADKQRPNEKSGFEMKRNVSFMNNNGWWWRRNMGRGLRAAG